MGPPLVGVWSWVVCRIVCVSPKENVVNTLHPTWGVGVCFDHILYLQKGGRNVPIWAGYVFVTHTNKCVDTPGVLVHGAQKGLSAVSGSAQEVFVTPPSISFLVGDACVQVLQAFYGRSSTWHRPGSIIPELKLYTIAWNVPKPQVQSFTVKGNSSSQRNLNICCVPVVSSTQRGFKRAGLEWQEKWE